MRLREALRFPALLECEELRQEFCHAKSSCGFRVSGFGLPKQPAMNLPDFSDFATGTKRKNHPKGTLKAVFAVPAGVYGVPTTVRAELRKVKDMT